MLHNVDLEKYAREAMAAVSPELCAAMTTHGFAKVASALSGADLSNERAVYEKIGSALFSRISERRAISRGLDALSALGE